METQRQLEHHPEPIAAARKLKTRAQHDDKNAYYLSFLRLVHHIYNPRLKRGGRYRPCVQ